MLNSSGGERLRQTISLVLGVGIVILLVWYTGYQEFLSSLTNTSLPLVGLGLLTYILTWPLRVGRMGVCLAILGSPIRAKNLLEISVAGYGLNIVLPAKIGDVALVVYLVQKGILIEHAAATVIYVRLADLASVSLLAIGTGVFLNVGVFPSWLQQILLGVVGLLVLLVMFVIVNRSVAASKPLTIASSRLRSLIASRLFHNAVDVGGRVSVNFDQLAFSRRVFFVSIVTSVGIWFLEALTAFAIALALGLWVPVSLIVFAVSIANIAKILPLTPGGLGIYEVAFTGVLQFFGFSPAPVVAVALIEHNLKNLFLVVVGIPLATKLGIEIV